MTGRRLNLAVRRGNASHGRSGTVINALAAIDIALWDIAGKASGKSVSTMLGGARRTRLPVMASLDKYDDKAKVRARLEQALTSGVKAAKVHEAPLEVIEEARRAVPNGHPVRRRQQQRAHAGRYQARGGDAGARSVCCFSKTRSGRRKSC